MRLRSIGAALASTLLAASLVACGSSNEAGETEAEQASSPSEAKTYVIAMDSDFPPFEFTDQNGTYVGIDVDLLAAIAADQNFEYELNPLGFDAALEAVQSGQADGVIAAMSITEKRKETFDFSDPYYDSTVCCAVPADSDIKSLDDLKGKTVAVKKGTLSKDWAESIQDQYGFEINIFDDSPTMVQDVGGNSVACFEDTPVMEYNISTGKLNFKIISEVKAGDEYASQLGFAVSKGTNPELLEKFNAGLANIMDNGTFVQVVSKYTGATTDDAQAAAEQPAESAEQPAEQPAEGAEQPAEQPAEEPAA